MARKRNDRASAEAELAKLEADEGRIREQKRMAKAKLQAIRDVRLLAVGRIADQAGIADFKDSDLLVAFQSFAGTRKVCDAVVA